MKVNIDIDKHLTYLDYNINIIYQQMLQVNIDLN